MTGPTLTPLQRAFLALEETRGRLAALEAARIEPIAIVGIGCRTPGDGDGPDALWRVFRDGVDAIGPVPPDRWDGEEFYDPRPQVPGKSVTREAGFVRQVDRFDAPLFGISPREARGIDPQQRLFLECAWEALEDAGIAPDALAGSRAGVYLGICTTDYRELQAQTNDPSLLDAHYSTGIAHSVASGRLSYILGLQGPAVSLDTACSSGLAAVHLACQSLRGGETRMAIAGGVNLMLSPDLSIAYSHSRMLAPDGRCKTFDAAADGFARGEGCGVIVLKRLADARADGDRIIALIRGSAMNQDGPSGGLTAPNGPSQVAVIREALAAGGVPPAAIGYVEAHGTGTQLGDPLEMQALGEVFGGDRGGVPLHVGSSKTNFGHLEGAAGIVGLIKVALSLQHATIAPHLHFRTPSPHIPWADLPVTIPTRLTPWPEIDGTRIGGVSSFGFSGTNVHVVLEQAPTPAPAAAGLDRPRHVVVLSAQREAALAAMAERLDAHLAEHDDALADVAHTLATGRARKPVRATFDAATTAEARTLLGAIARGEQAAGIHRGVVSPAARPRVAFLFTGQGAQYAGMGRDLYDTSPAFRAALDQCAAALDPLLPDPLLPVMFGERGTDRLDQTGVAQPALFALEYALAALWRTWGVEPVALIGHSVGEVTAACVAGVLSLPDAARLIAARGRLMQALPEGGGMRGVGATLEEVEAIIARAGVAVEVAAVNAPRRTVVAGAVDALAMVDAVCHAAGVRTQALVVSHAFHSALMEPMLDAFEREIATLTYGAPQIRIVSNVTGGVADADLHRSAAYWRRHVRSPVRFADGVRALASLPCDVMLEIGPHPVLAALGQECVADETIAWGASLRRDREAWPVLFDTLQRFHLRGVPVDWAGVDRGHPRRRVALPTYPFQRERAWFEARPTRRRVGSGAREAHPLLGTRRASPLPQAQFESSLAAATPAFIADHVVTGTALLPGTASLEMARAAADAMFGPGAHVVESLVLREAMIFDDTAERSVQTIVEPPEDDAAEFRILSRADDSDRWTLHFEGRIRREPAGDPVADELLSAASERCRTPASVEDLGAALRRQGFEFGARFRSVREVHVGTREAVAVIELPESARAEATAYGMHPALLDGCVQSIAAALPPALHAGDGDALYLPVGVGAFRLVAPVGWRCTCHVVLNEGAVQGDATLRATVRVFGDEGRPAAELRDLELRRVGHDALRRLADRHDADWLYAREWEEQPRPAVAAGDSPTPWVILADRGGVGTALAAAMRAGGASPLLVSADDAYASRADAAVAAWREALGASFGVLDLRWLDVLEWMARDATSAQAVRTAVEGTLAVAQALVRAPSTSSGRFVVVTRGAQSAGVAGVPLSPWQSAAWGMMGTVALEHAELRPVCIDLDPGADADEISTLAAELAHLSSEWQVAFRAGQRLVPRFVRANAVPSRTNDHADGAYALVARTRGTLDALEITRVDRRAPSAGEVEIRVGATGLNFRDVLNALGLYPGDAGPLGGECAGVITRVGSGMTDFAEGDRVMAMAPASFGGHVIARRELTYRIPCGITLVEAAALPIAYLTAAFALDHLAELRRGERVLIHAAAGGVGMAAVHIALRRGAQVFATAGSRLKRARLAALGVPHVLDSRSTTFADQIAEHTDGRGVDVVLNSLSGEFIDASMRAIASGGRFIEIGKRGIWEPGRVAALGRSIRYHIVDVGATAEQEPVALERLMRGVLADIGAGRLPPLPVTVFPLDRARDAFRYMMQARQIGKVVVTHEPPAARRAAMVRGDGAYLVTGGLSGLGLAAAEWLAANGAGHLVLIGRRGMTAEAEPVVERMRALGVAVRVIAGDAADATTAREALHELGVPVRGVLHAAGLLDDASILSQDWSHFARVLAPKVDGLRALEDAVRDAPLDWFVAFSSISSLIGSAGQANYAGANAVLDTAAHERRRLGRPALAIGWGSWSEIGMSAGAELRARLEARGLRPFSPEQGLRVLGSLLGGDAIHVGAAIVDWGRHLAQRSSDGGVPPYFARMSGAHSAAQPSRATDGPSLRERVAAQPPGRREAVVRQGVRDCAQRVLGLNDPNAIDDRAPLLDVGLDSLLAVELRNMLGRALDASLPATLLFDYPSIEELTRYVCRELVADIAPPAGGAEARATAPAGGSAVLASIAQLSDEEVEQMLLAKRERAGR